MRFDTASIGFLRNPYGDESLVDIVRAAAVCDAGLKVSTLVQCIDMPELRIDLLSPDADLPAHFGKYHPDILIMPSELLGEDFFAELTIRQRGSSRPLPALVIVGGEPADSVRDLLNDYRSRVHIGRGDPFAGGDTVRRFVAHELLDRDLLSRKLRESAALSLLAMHADRCAGFDYLLDEVTTVLESSYVYFGSAAALHRQVSERRGVTVAAVDLAVRPVVEKALRAMTGDEYRLCFSAYLDRGIKPGIPEFVYAAAELTSVSCMRLLHLLRGLPIGSKLANIHIKSK